MFIDSTLDTKNSPVYARGNVLKYMDFNKQPDASRIFFFYMQGWYYFFALAIALWEFAYGLRWLAYQMNQNFIYELDNGDTWRRFAWLILILVLSCIFIPFSITGAKWAIKSYTGEDYLPLLDVRESWVVAVRALVDSVYHSVAYMWALVLYATMGQWFAVLASYGAAPTPYDLTAPLTVFGPMDGTGIMFSAAIVASGISFAVWAILFWPLKSVFGKNQDMPNVWSTMKVMSQHDFIEFMGTFWGLWLGIDVVLWAIETWFNISLPYALSDAWARWVSMLTFSLCAWGIRVMYSWLITRLENEPRALPVKSMFKWAVPVVASVAVACLNTFSIATGIADSWNPYPANQTAVSGACITHVLGASTPYTVPNYQQARYPRKLFGQAFAATVVIVSIIWTIMWFWQRSKETMRLSKKSTKNLSSSSSSTTTEALLQATAQPKQRMLSDYHVYYRLVVFSEAFAAAYYAVTDLTYGMISSANPGVLNPVCYYPPVNASATTGATFLVVAIGWAIIVFFNNTLKFRGFIVKMDDINPVTSGYDE